MAPWGIEGSAFLPNDECCRCKNVPLPPSSVPGGVTPRWAGGGGGEGIGFVRVGGSVPPAAVVGVPLVEVVPNASPAAFFFALACSTLFIVRVS
jgi:hypothetical protein